MHRELRMVAALVVLVVLIVGSVVVAWIRADRKKARVRRAILDGLER